MGKNFDSGTWSMDVSDYLGRKIHIEIPYNTTTKAIVNPGLTGTRDAGCHYDFIQIGRAEDPNGIKVFPIPDGSFSVNRAQLGQQGFDTIADLDAANVTFGHTGA